MKIYDGKGLVAGRLAARTVKILLSGEEAIIANANDIVMSGSHAYHQGILRENRAMADKKDPEKTAKFPRIPHLLFKKIISGMLPKKSQRGRDALKRLKVYDGVPEGVDLGKAEKADDLAKPDLAKSTTLGKLCKSFGYKQ